MITQNGFKVFKEDQKLAKYGDLMVDLSTSNPY